MEKETVEGGREGDVTPSNTKQILFLAFSLPQRSVRGAMLRVVPSF